MKVAIFGCKNTTKFLIEELSKKVTIHHLITISEDKSKKFDVADYCSLTDVSHEKNIVMYHCKTYSLKSKEDIDHIKSLKIDLAFVIGWQRIIPEIILNSLTVGAFGMHGSSMNLPLGRGRSPMNWSLIEGRKHFYTNLFKYDADVDSGDILDTLKFSISDRDTAETMHFKNTLAMKNLIERNIDKLLNNDVVLRKQRQTKPTFYPKRTPDDSLINWSTSVYDIDRFIRSVTKPFNGAFTFTEEAKVTLYSAQVFDSQEFGYEASEVGEVVAIFSNGKFLVKCLDGLLLVNDYKVEGSQSIKTNTVLDNGCMALKYFQTNKFGKYDLEQD